jgi:prepilin-type N-terminal cleavage/methylation domain-containing protein
MRRLLAWWPRDRRQAQSGSTLIELLVAVVIMGLALTLIIGTFSTGLLEASMAKRNTAATAVTQYELERISGAAYGSLPTQYSDCFATEASTGPTAATGYSGACAGSSFTLRVDVNSESLGNNTQRWSITVHSWPSAAQIGTMVQTIKVNHHER